MNSFLETLDRVLDPEGPYWTHPDEDNVDPSVERTVELRIDVPSLHVATVIESMKQDGWDCAERPDDPSDPNQRVYFQRRQNLLSATKVKMLTNALRIVFPIESARLWSWIIIEDQGCVPIAHRAIE